MVPHCLHFRSLGLPLGENEKNVESLMNIHREAVLELELVLFVQFFLLYLIHSAGGTNTP